LKLSANTLLRKLFGTVKVSGIVSNQELHKFYSSPNLIEITLPTAGDGHGMQHKLGEQV
jgi:hypothetical protein